MIVAIAGALSLPLGVAGSEALAGRASKVGRGVKEQFRVEIMAGLDRAGNPSLIANFLPDGSLATPRWSICPRARPTGCRRVRTVDGVLAPGPQPAGTRFLARATYRSRTYSATAIWHGRVRAVSLPTMSGSARFGAVLHPRAAQWVGGWGTELDQLGIEACRRSTGQQCRMLGGGELGCPDHSSNTRLGDWFTGWYVFAVDARLPRDGVCAGTGYFANAALPLWPLGATVVRSEALGKISGPPRPTVRIFPHARLLAGGVLAVASLDCNARCHVWLTVSDRREGVSRHLSFSGRRTIGVRARALKAGKLTIGMYIDDSPQVVGTTHFR